MEEPEETEEEEERAGGYSCLALSLSLLAPSIVEIIHIDEATRDEEWHLLEARPDEEWSLVDASSFVLMWRHGMAEALTTDHHFEQAGFTRVPAQL